MIEICRAGIKDSRNGVANYGVLYAQMVENTTSYSVSYEYRFVCDDGITRTLNVGDTTNTYVKIDNSTRSYSNENASVGNNTALVVGSFAKAKTYDGQGNKSTSFEFEISINIGGDIYKGYGAIVIGAKAPTYEDVENPISIGEQEFIRAGGYNSTYSCDNYAILNYSETLENNTSTIAWNYKFAINPPGYSRTINYGNTTNTYVEIDGTRSSYTSTTSLSNNAAILSGTKTINRTNTDSVNVKISVNIGGDIYTSEGVLNLIPTTPTGEGSVYICYGNQIHRGHIFVGVNGDVKSSTAIYIGANGVKRGV